MRKIGKMTKMSYRTENIKALINNNNTTTHNIT